MNNTITALDTELLPVSQSHCVVTKDDLKAVWVSLAQSFRDAEDYIDIALGEATTSVLLDETSFGSIRGRLHSIAKHKLIDECRRRRRLLRIAIVENAEGMTSLADFDFEQRSLDHVMIDELLAHLSIKQSEAIRLHCIEGYSEKEAAGIIGISANSMKDRVKNARKELRRFAHARR